MPDEQRPETAEEQIRCKRCGASLHGLEHDANCQACGSPVSISLSVGYERGTSIPDFLDPVDLRCARCGESLSKVPKRSLCPNCKLPVKQSLSSGSWTSVVGADGVVESDAACRKCGYNLRGLPELGDCPECGTAVALSIRGDFLCYADPAWSRKIARGSLWISRGMISVAASLTGVCLCAFSVATVGGATVFGLGMIGALALIGGSLLVYVGTWIITTPDPAAPPHATGVTARKLIRIGLLVFFFEIVLDAIVENAGVPTSVWITVQVLGIPISIISVIATVAYFGYFAKLTARIPNDVLTRRAVSLRVWAGLGVATVSLVATVEMLYEALVAGAPATGLAAPPTPVAGGRSVMFTVVSVSLGVFGGITLLISAVRTIGLQWQFATAAREQAARAEANWSGVPVAEPADE